MKKKSAEEIMEDFYEEYQADPEGWSFWISRSPSTDDFHEAYMIHDDEAFFLKIDSIYTPSPIGVGAKLKVEEDQLVDDLPDFGYRKFSREEAERFLRSIPKPWKYESEDKFRRDLKKSREKFVEKALGRETVPFEPPEEPGGLAAIGPYIAKSPLSYVSSKQEELKEELSRKLERIIRRDYPGYY